MARKKSRKKERYILIFDKSSTKNIQDELEVKFTSSAELSKEVSADQILETDKGILFKNLGVAVAEDIEPERLQKNYGGRKILYWEKDRVYTTSEREELIQLEKIKKQLSDLQLDVEKLETLLNGAVPMPEPELEYTWGLTAMGIPLSSLSGNGVSICVLDTGFYAAHPDFAGRTITGKSFIPGQAWDFDGDGHGTHCVGVAAGNISEDGVRYGVANKASIAVGKVLDDEGNGLTSGVIDGIDWALEKKFQILSMSLASPVAIGEAPSPIFEQIGLKALLQGSIIVAAAGNDSNRPDVPRPVSSPANADSIMAIAAVSEALQVARFSNGGINAGTGGKVDLAAPGVEIFSSYSANSKDKLLYRIMKGTSMATPHISGLAALYLERDPDLSPRALWKLLEKNAQALGGQLPRDVGAGLGYFK